MSKLQAFAYHEMIWMPEGSDYDAESKIWACPPGFEPPLNTEGLFLATDVKKIADVSTENVELLAPLFYDLIPFNETHRDKPKWVPNGNSLMQDLARAQARKALNALKEKYGV